MTGKTDPSVANIDFEMTENSNSPRSIGRSMSGLCLAITKNPVISVFFSFSDATLSLTFFFSDFAVVLNRSVAFVSSACPRLMQFLQVVWS